MKLHLLILLAITSILAFTKLHTANIEEWDESRYGVNALGIIERGDPVNIYYGDERETWNVKPPLFIWSVAASYKIFGTGTFALRFPSAVFGILIILLTYFLIKKYHSDNIAFLSCLILLSCKAVFGSHIARTGDADAMLIFLLMISVFLFLQYTQKNKPSTLIWLAVILGIAFYVKGLASLILIPGFILFLLAEQKAKSTLLSKHFVLATFVYLVIVSSWIYITTYVALPYESSHYGDKNATETILITDFLTRFFEKPLDDQKVNNYTYLFTVLDAKMNLWNYIFFLAIAVLLFKTATQGYSKIKNYITKDPLILLSICTTLSLSIFLTFAKTKHVWYLAPVFPFIAFLIAYFLHWSSSKNKKILFLIIPLLLFTLIRHIIHIVDLKTDKYEYFMVDNFKAFQNAELICTEGHINQSSFLYLKFCNPNILKLEDDALHDKCDIRYKEGF